MPTPGICEPRSLHWEEPKCRKQADAVANAMLELHLHHAVVCVRRCSTLSMDVRLLLDQLIKAAQGITE